MSRHLTGAAGTVMALLVSGVGLAAQAPAPATAPAAPPSVSTVQVSTAQASTAQAGDVPAHAAAGMRLAFGGLSATSTSMSQAPQAQTAPAQPPAAATVSAQPPAPAPQSMVGQRPMTTAPVMKLAFREAVDRALQRNPTIADATAQILRANALLRQARAVLLPTINGSLSDTLSSNVIQFDGQSISPRNSFTATVPAAWQLSAVEWARRNQAQDNTVTAQRALDETRRQIANSAAQAYLAIIVQRRLVDASARAVETAKAHSDLAQQQFDAGAGSRLNLLRAQQEMSADQVALENSEVAVYQAQEALGVLLAADGAVDITEEPALDLPPGPDTLDAQVGARTDIRLAAATQAAAERVLADSWKDRLPTFGIAVTPTFLEPSTLFSPRWTTPTVFSSTVPIFDGGLRTAQKLERQALLDQTKASSESVRRQAGSEIRAAQELIKSAERSLAAARAAAAQATQVVDITNIAFRAGASTNIEVIDAQRAARDADTNAAVEEDRLRRAKLDLLVASGRFPLP